LGVGWGSNKYKIFEKENTLKVQILLKCIILYMTWSHFHFILVSIFLPNFPFYLVEFSKWSANEPFIIYIFCATIHDWVLYFLPFIIFTNNDQLDGIIELFIYRKNEGPTCHYA
jgi:hypothetical protein